MSANEPIECMIIRRKGRKAGCPLDGSAEYAVHAEGLRFKTLVHYFIALLNWTDAGWRRAVASSNSTAALWEWAWTNSPVGLHSQAAITSAMEAAMLAICHTNLQVVAYLRYTQTRRLVCGEEDPRWGGPENLFGSLWESVRAEVLQAPATPEESSLISRRWAASEPMQE